MLFEHPNWYECNGKCPDQPRGNRYEFPLPEVKNAPVPSTANYSQTNVAWVIEMFAGILGQSEKKIALRYENNTPNDKTDDIIVTHPGDKLYYEDAAKCRAPSKEYLAYERAAKKSKTLKLYMENSPAGIQYFQPICKS